MRRSLIVGTTVALIVIGVLYLFIVFSGLGWAFYDANSPKILRKRKLTNNIEEAKERGVFIKDLKYKADSTVQKFEFHPYIEKAFRYGRDATETLPAINTNYPYRLGFQNQIESVIIFIEDEELNKFDSSAGSGYAGASGYLRKPSLHDTVILGVRRSGIVLGTIKVWN